MKLRTILESLGDPEPHRFPVSTTKLLPALAAQLKQRLADFYDVDVNDDRLTLTVRLPRKPELGSLVLRVSYGGVLTLGLVSRPGGPPYRSLYDSSLHDDSITRYASTPDRILKMMLATIKQHLPL